MTLRFTLFIGFSVLAHAGLLLWAGQPAIPTLGIGGDAQALRVAVASRVDKPATATPGAETPPAPADTKTARRMTDASNKTPPPPFPVSSFSNNGERGEQAAPAAQARSAAGQPLTSAASLAGGSEKMSPSPFSGAEKKAPSPVPGEGRRQSSEDVGRRISVALKNRLSRYFEYPWLARQRGWEGRVLLSLTVTGNGDLGNWRVVQTSGYRTLDQSALKAARRIGSLPQARAWLNGRSIEVQVPVQYRLLDS